MEITWIGALIGGLLSFLSPCVLPLVPPYLCFMAGVSYEQLQEKHRSKGLKFDFNIIIPAIFFIVGFTIIFVLMGATASLLGRFLLKWQEQIAILAGIIIVLMGLHFLGLLRINFLLRDARFRPKMHKAGPVGSFIMGLAFAFGWTPCIGPILTPIVSLAAKAETVLDGSILLAIYSLGLGIPFLLAAIFSRLFISLLGLARIHLALVEKIIGVLLIIAGILFISGQLQNISNWFIDTFPFLLNLG